MRIIIFDFEVFAHDWIIVFKELHGDFLCIAHNNNDEVIQFMNTPDIIIAGFNNKHYDNFILTAILNDASPEVVKDINDFIIVNHGNGWDHPFIQAYRSYFKSFDLMDDTQDGTSLKSIEAHLGMNIKETDVDFNLDRSLTEEELQLTVEYCKADVVATEILCDLRKKYLETKMKLGRMRDIPDYVSLNCTNAKIVAKYLKAKYVARTDGREYQYPKNLDTSVIPKSILDFFDTIHDKSIPDEVLFKTSHEITLGGCPCKYAWGGVHGSQIGYSAESDDEWIIQNRDVSSLYPSLMLLYRYISRNCESFEVYADTYHERIAAKHAGDKEKAGALKLPLNTCSGAADQKYNDLYDPLSARSMRISGQLFLTELLMNLVNACPSMTVINFNTDGIMYIVKRSEIPKVDEVCKSWEKTTGFELETDGIKKVFVKDVNNLLFIGDDGHVKKVGGYLNYGISDKGAWSINNNFIIVKDALAKYLSNGTPVEKTIMECDEIFKFQIIAKAGGSYIRTYHQVDGEMVQVQRCNRVYASKDRRYGTLYKLKTIDGNPAKIGGLPAHCIVDNDNKFTIDVVDKSWYIDLAKQYIGDYQGKRRKKVGKRQLNALKKNITKIMENFINGNQKR